MDQENTLAAPQFTIADKSRDLDSRKTGFEQDIDLLTERIENSQVGPNEDGNCSVDMETIASLLSKILEVSSKFPVFYFDE